LGDVDGPSGRHAVAPGPAGIEGPAPVSLASGRRARSRWIPPPRTAKPLAVAVRGSATW